MDFLQTQNSALDLLGGGASLGADTQKSTYKSDQNQRAKDFVKEYDRFDEQRKTADAPAKSQQSHEKPKTDKADGPSKAQNGDEARAEGVENTESQEASAEQEAVSEEAQEIDAAKASSEEETVVDDLLSLQELLSDAVLALTEQGALTQEQIVAVEAAIEVLPKDAQGLIDLEQLLNAVKTQEGLALSEVVNLDHEFIAPDALKAGLGKLALLQGDQEISSVSQLSDLVAELDPELENIELEADLRPALNNAQLRQDANPGVASLITGLGELPQGAANIEAFEEAMAQIGEGARFGDTRADGARPRLDFVAGLQASNGIDAAKQVVAAIRANATGGAIEVRLDPPELGQVRISFQMERTDIVAAVVNAEKTDTMDIMRRHADELAAALEKAGFSGVDLQFQSQSGDGQSANGGGSQFGDQEFFDSGPAMNSEVVYLSMRTDNRLDRLV